MTDRDAELRAAPGRLRAHVSLLAALSPEDRKRALADDGAPEASGAPGAHRAMEWVSSNGWQLLVAEAPSTPVEMAEFDEWITLVSRQLRRRMERQRARMVDGDLWHRDLAVMTGADIGVEP